MGHSASLVAMATHGRGGVARWVRGSVAERVLRAATTPLLLANPRAVERRGTSFARILVPLDGSERSAEVLPLVAELARAYDSEVVLLHAAYDPMGQVHVLASPDQPAREDALRPFLERLRAAGARARAEVVAGEPAGVILDAAERDDVDLVAMSTHGRTGLDRWASGSVAEKALRECRRPLLIVRRPAGGAPA